MIDQALPINHGPLGIPHKRAGGAEVSSSCSTCIRRRVPLDALVRLSHSIRGAHCLLNFSVQVERRSLSRRHRTRLVVDVRRPHLNRILLLPRCYLKHLAVIEQSLLVHIEPVHGRAAWLRRPRELEI